MKFRAFTTMEEVRRIVSEDGLTKIEVLCGTELHRIEIENGRIILRDHSDECVQEEEIQSALAGDEPRISCVRIKKQLDDWRQRDLLIFSMLILACSCTVG